MARSRWFPLVLVLAACDEARTPPAPRVDPGAAPIPAVWVVLEGSMVAHSLDTGEPGGLEVGQITSPFSITALEDATLLVPMTELGRLAAVDGRFMKERKRWLSSEAGATRPQGGGVARLGDGTLVWTVAHTGRPMDDDDSTIAFVDVDPDHTTRFSRLGEIGVPRGPHAHALADGGQLVVASQRSCDRTFLSFDVDHITDAAVERRLEATALGFDGVLGPVCDAGLEEATPRPLGCVALQGALACAVGPYGRVAIVDDAGGIPSVATTGGRGVGVVAAGPDGAMLLVAEASPREGDGGVDCQIGQLAVIDPLDARTVAAIPLLLEGPACARRLAGTDEASLRPGALWVHAATGRVFVGLDATGDGARGRHLLVLEGAPLVQVASLELPSSDGPAIGALSLGGHWLVVGRPLVRQVVKIDPFVPALTLAFSTRAPALALAASRDPAREAP